MKYSSIECECLKGRNGSRVIRCTNFCNLLIHFWYKVVFFSVTAIYITLLSLSMFFSINCRILPNTPDRNAAFLNNDNRRSQLNNDPCNFFVQPTAELYVEVRAGFITHSCKDIVAGASEVILVFIKGGKMPSAPGRTGILAQNYKSEREKWI